ncbi:MAG: histone deacetylase [Deltaproteobacteria bacterium]|nr:histone deacetylase [Deltaproteobacteria bacterium]
MGLNLGIAADHRFFEHKTGHFHPESPRRLDAVYRMLDREFSGRLVRFTPAPATMEDIERVHTPGHIEQILMTANQRTTSLAPDTPVSAMTYMAAWLAAGACIDGASRLIKKEVDAFFALVRPPGHHALSGRAGGFCVFNNLAIAARYASSVLGLDRILIVDFDIHHGNGLNDIFYDDQNCYYFSTHDLMLYPYSGDIDQAGSGKGLGYTMNIPIERDFSDDDMVFVYEQTLLPVIRGYRPDLIMVAAGFDGHADDPIGRNRFSSMLYGRLTRLIVEAAGLFSDARVPLLFCLEGGYEPRALAESVGSVISALIEDWGEGNKVDAPSPSAVKLVEDVMKIHRQYGVIS